MDKKTMAFVSYITLIGWLIAFFSYKGKEKSALVSYHLRQALGLFLTVFCINITVNVLSIILGSLAGILGIVSLIVSITYLVLLIIGILTANKKEEKPLPIIGKMFEGKFNFIP